MKLVFITAIPLNVQQGSGCYVGIQTLARGVRGLGVQVELATPGRQRLPFALHRIGFNETLRNRDLEAAATIGVDLDGYQVAGRVRAPHIAAIKGVLGDNVRFENGAARASLRVQAYLEKLHARRADKVITTSRYCAERLQELYGVRDVSIVPELIDLDAWEELFARNPARGAKQKFTVLCVCRFYPRKRVDVLLRAAAALFGKIPELEVRVVGNGPEKARLMELWRSLGLERVVRWVGDATADELAAEYNRADVFCLPSVQEGFGIVFLEAMAAGKPIVATRAGAVPEVVPQGLLVEPGSAEALSDAILSLYYDSRLRTQLAECGRRWVRNFEMKRVACQFLETLGVVRVVSHAFGGA